jgi:hypothetical protein
MSHARDLGAGTAEADDEHRGALEPLAGSPAAPAQFPLALVLETHGNGPGQRKDITHTHLGQGRVL